MSPVSDPDNPAVDFSFEVGENINKISVYTHSNYKLWDCGGL
jgi:hypothetical protein